jgi:hypothetical protein
LGTKIGNFNPVHEGLAIFWRLPNQPEILEKQVLILTIFNTHLLKVYKGDHDDRLMNYFADLERLVNTHSESV